MCVVFSPGRDAHGRAGVRAGVLERHGTVCLLSSGRRREVHGGVVLLEEVEGGTAVACLRACLWRLLCELCAGQDTGGSACARWHGVCRAVGCCNGGVAAACAVALAVGYGAMCARAALGRALHLGAVE